MYSIRFCKRHSGLSATVFDSANSLELAKDTIAAEHMQERVSIKAGDYWHDEFGDQYDVALLFNIVHAHLPEMNAKLLRKINGALTMNGMVVILEQLKGQINSPTARAINRFFGLAYLATLGGQTYRFEEISGWLESAGFVNVSRINLRSVPGNTLIVARKKSF